MKKDFETKFTGWALITAAIFLLSGWVLSFHHTGEYLAPEDFEAIGQNLWYWIWMFRVHIFGWVIMGAAMMAFAVIAFENPYRILLVPGAGVVIVGPLQLPWHLHFTTHTEPGALVKLLENHQKKYSNSLIWLLS